MRSPIIRSAHLYTIHLFFRDGLTAHQRLTLVSHTWQGPFDHHTSFPPPSCCATALSRQREAARYMYGCDKGKALPTKSPLIMPFLFRTVFFLLSFKLFGISGNAPASHGVRAATVTVLTDDQITAYKPYTFFAGAAYCQPSTTMNWDCGCEY